MDEKKINNMKNILKRTNHIMQLVADIQKYDPHDSNNKQLIDDWQVACRLYQRIIIEKKKSVYTYEDILNFAKLIYMEILRRIKDGRIKYVFKPEQMKPACRELYRRVMKPIIGTIIEKEEEGEDYLPVFPGGTKPRYKKLGINDFLKRWKSMVLKEPCVYLVGSLPNWNISDGDIDIVIRDTEDSQNFERIKWRIQRAFPDLMDRFQFHDDAWHGQFTNYVNLGKLMIMAPEKYRVMKMEDMETEENLQVRTTDPKVLKDVKTSKEQDKIKMFRMFAPLKGIHGYRTGEKYDVAQVATFFKPEDYPLITQKKYDGNRQIIFKQGDKVEIWTEDGTRVCPRMPRIVSELKKIQHPRDFILDAETEMWVGKEHKSREIVAGYLHGKGKPDDSNLVVNVFDMLYCYDPGIKKHDLNLQIGDIHNEEYAIRLKYLDLLPFKQSTIGVPNISLSHLNRTPDYISDRPAKLMQDIKINSEAIASEGAMIKSSHSIYPLTGMTSKWVKFKNMVEIHAKIWRRNTTKTKGVYNYDVCLRVPTGIKVDPKYIVKFKRNPNIYLKVGRSYNTKTFARPGQICTLSIHTLNVYRNPETGEIRLHIYEPRWYELRPEQTEPDSIIEAIRIAREAKVLQVKKIGSEMLEDPFMEYPPEGWVGRYVVQHHYRAGIDPKLKPGEKPLASAHADVRFELPDYLIGMTWADQMKGMVPDVRTMQEAKRIDKDVDAWKIDWSKGLFKKIKTVAGRVVPREIFAVPKAREPCISGDSFLIKNQSLTRAEDLKIGDSVLGADGNFTEVTNIKRIKPISKIYEIKPSHSLSSKVTAYHPFLVNDVDNRSFRLLSRKGRHIVKNTLKPVWRKAEDLKINDILLFPKLKCHEKYLSSYSDGKLVGFYLGDGNISFCGDRNSEGKYTQKVCRFNFNSKLEEKKVELYQKMLKKKGINSWLQYRKDSVIVLTFTILKKNPSKVMKLISECWQNHQKHIPQRFIEANKSFLKGLIDGLLDSDGYISKEPRKHIINSNMSILNGAYLILHKLDKVASIRYRDNLGSYGKDCKIGEISWYENKRLMHFDYGEYIGKRLKGIKETFLNTVYSIETANHTFCLPYIATHNSEWLFFDGVVKPGSIGATRFGPGVFTIIDKGKIEWGTLKSYYREFFLYGDKLKGRIVYRLLPAGKYKRIGEEKYFWVVIQPLDMEPYVISRRAVTKKWIPPLHVSALPDSIKKQIPSEFHYWASKIKTKKDALRVRDLLVEMIKKRKIKIDYNKIKISEPPALSKKLDMDESRELALGRDYFILQHHWVRGQKVVRAGPSTQHFDLGLKGTKKEDKDRWILLSNPVETDKNASIHEPWTSVEWNNHAIVIPKSIKEPLLCPPGHPLNFKKKADVFIQTLDYGYCTILDKKHGFLKIRFNGRLKNLMGIWVLKQETPKEKIWGFNRAVSIGEPFSLDVEKKESLMGENGWVKVIGIALRPGWFKKKFFSIDVLRNAVLIPRDEERISPIDLFHSEDPNLRIGALSRIWFDASQKYVEKETGKTKQGALMYEGFIFDPKSIDALINKRLNKNSVEMRYVNEPHVESLKIDGLGFVINPACTEAEPKTICDDKTCKTLD